MDSASNTNQPKRLGIHYFPDTNHYREQDANDWIPKLQSLGFSWLILSATTERAIPEYFIKALINSGIKPVLHFDTLSLSSAQPGDIGTLIEPYGKWGVEYAILFDRPNCRQVWTSQTWAQSNLVERYLDIFIPIAEIVLSAGISPVFSPLEPGGDYWDTAFLREALKGIQRRDANDLSEKLVLSAYVSPGTKPLSWGAGGPERWPEAKPYFTSDEQQDQRGFNIFTWYQSIAQAVLDKNLPIILLESKSNESLHTSFSQEDNKISEHDSQCLAIARLLTENIGSVSPSPSSGSGLLETIPEEVLSFNYFLLAAEPQDSTVEQAWYKADGSMMPVVDLIQNWKAKLTNVSDPKVESKGLSSTSPIEQYVLIPDCHEDLLIHYLETLRPYILKHKPVIGFSVEEALIANQISLVGDIQQYPSGTLEKLLSSNSKVEQLFRNGTDVATSISK